MTYDVTQRVAHVTFNRPDSLNSITEQVLSDLDAVISAVQDDESVRAMVLRGSGRAFCVGLDLELLQRAFSDAGYFASVIRRLGDLLLRLEDLPVPVVGVANGLARAGGMEILLACDMVIVADEARIGDNHTNFGVMPGGGSTARLPRKIGDQRAKELILTARWLTGPEAVDYGVALRSVPETELDDAVEELLAGLRDKSRNCSAAVKRAMARTAVAPIRDAVAAELDEFVRYVCAPGSDAQEGLAASLERRAPNWS